MPGSSTTGTGGPRHARQRQRDVVMTGVHVALAQRAVAHRRLSEETVRQALPGYPGRVLSWRSKSSFLSVCSEGSVLSVGSIGSVASIGSIGSVLSVGSLGSLMSAMSMLSQQSNCSILSRRSNCCILSEESNTSILSSRADRSALGRPPEPGPMPLRHPASGT
jgi:hypothetical protein